MKINCSFPQNSESLSYKCLNFLWLRKKGRFSNREFDTVFNTIQSTMESRRCSPRVGNQSQKTVQAKTDPENVLLFLKWHLKRVSDVGKGKSL